MYKKVIIGLLVIIGILAITLLSLTMSSKTTKTVEKKTDKKEVVVSTLDDKKENTEQEEEELAEEKKEYVYSESDQVFKITNEEFINNMNSVSEIKINGVEDNGESFLYSLSTDEDYEKRIEENNEDKSFLHLFSNSFEDSFQFDRITFSYMHIQPFEKEYDIFYETSFLIANELLELTTDEQEALKEKIERIKNQDSELPKNKFRVKELYIKSGENNFIYLNKAEDSLMFEVSRVIPNEEKFLWLKAVELLPTN